MNIFHSVYYYDGSAEDFILAGIFTKKEDAEIELAAIPEKFKPKVIVEETLEGIKKRLLDSAIGDARRIVRDMKGFPLAIASENET